MGVVLERGHHPKVAAAAAQCPEQIGILVRRAAHPSAVHRHHLAGYEIVDGGAVAAHQVTDAATEGESGHAGAADGSGRHHQAEIVCCAVQFAE